MVPLWRLRIDSLSQHPYKSRSLSANQSGISLTSIDVSLAYPGAEAMSLGPSSEADIILCGKLKDSSTYQRNSSRLRGMSLDAYRRGDTVPVLHEAFLGSGTCWYLALGASNEPAMRSHRAFWQATLQRA